MLQLRISSGKVCMFKYSCKSGIVIFAKTKTKWKSFNLSIRIFLKKLITLLKFWFYNPCNIMDKIIMKKLSLRRVSNPFIKWCLYSSLNSLLYSNVWAWIICRINMHNENNYDTFSLCAEVSLLIPINYSPQIHILNLLHSACICTLHTTLSQRSCLKISKYLL